MAEVQTYWLLAGLVLLHLLTLAYAYWRQRDEPPRGDDRHAALQALDRPTGSDVTFDADTITVNCGVCGTENDASYSFCRACVEELPGAPGGTDDAASAFGSGSV